MKLLLILSLLAYTVPDYWIRDVERRVELFDVESHLIKEKTDTSGFDCLIARKYKSGNLEKLHLAGKSEGIDTIDVKFYTKGKFIYAQLELVITGYLQKGQPAEDQPANYIEESKTYYKNKKEGILLNRIIDYGENADLDSLKYVLSTMKFDTVILTAEHYQRTVNRFKKSKKRFL